MIQRPEWNLRTLAHNEAGHCVAWFHTDARGVFSVAVYPKGQLARGRVRGGACAHHEAPLLADPREQAIADLFAACAGRAAERVLLGHERPWPTHSDGPLAWRLAHQIVGPSKAVAERLCVEQDQKAIEVLGKPTRWPAVAERLQVQHRLAGKEARRIAREAIAKAR